jgi:carbonyl reductase 1
MANFIGNSSFLTESVNFFQVTGGNKGIGYAIAEGLCERFNGTVYLTARDEARGREAVAKLNQVNY